MSGAKLCIIFLLIFYDIYESFSDTIRGLEVIPERAEIAYTNSKYVYNNSISVRRNSRRGPYVVNFKGFILHQWANNVSIDIVLHEYLHNEYKPSFIEMHFKLCDLINKDEFIGSTLRNAGVKCPMDRGFVGLTNATMSRPTFAYMFPFEKCRAEITFKTAHDIIGSGYLYISIKQVPLNRMKN